MSCVTEPMRVAPIDFFFSSVMFSKSVPNKQKKVLPLPQPTMIS